jgi:Domain of unknown function (DUF4349)
VTVLHLRAKSTRVRLAAVAALLVIVGGVACSSIGRLAPTNDQAQVNSAPNARPVSQQAPSTNPPPVAPVAGGAGAAAAVARDAVNPSKAQSPESSAVADTSAQILDRMVIRTAQLSVEVQDMESALTKARAIASQAGGFVSTSNTRIERNDDQDRMVADLTLQVRSGSADSAMSDLRALGKVTSETSGSQDVTDEYVDLDSNLRNLQASETAILKLMDKATQISDVLTLQRELTNVRGQIERIQGRKTYLERRTDMATITLSLRLPPATPTQLTAGAWDPLAIAVRGWQASLTVLRGVASVAIVAAAFSWWLVPFLALGGYVWLRRRRAATPPAVVPVETA